MDTTQHTTTTDPELHEGAHARVNVEVPTQDIMPGAVGIVVGFGNEGPYPTTLLTFGPHREPVELYTGDLSWTCRPQTSRAGCPREHSVPCVNPSCHGRTYNHGQLCTACVGGSF